MGNIVYLDEALKEAFDKRASPARVVQFFAFLAHQGCHTGIFEPGNLPKEFIEETYAGLAELEIYILAGKRLRKKVRRTVKSDFLERQNRNLHNIVLDKLLDLADEYDITASPKALDFYHDWRFTFVGEGKFVAQIVLCCRRNLIPENLRKLYSYLKTQQKRKKIEPFEAGSTLLSICENLSRRGYDKEGVKELKRLIEDKDWPELTTSFFREVTFGTAGIRGVRGRVKDSDTAEEGKYLPGPNRINLDTIRRYALGVSNYICKRHLQEQGVVLARDTRIGSRRFVEEVVKVLRRKGIKVFRFEADRPVAEMALAVVELGAALGIEITASHNFASDNGYKISNEFGAQLFGPQRRAIVAEIERVEIENVDGLVLDEFDLERDRKEHSDLLRIIGGSDTDRDMDWIYKDRVKDYVLNPSVVKENASRVKIVYDPLFGAGRNIVYELLKDELGFDVHRYEPHSVSDGRFPGLLKNPDPQEEGILDAATNWADTLGEIDFILGTDPDSDRAGFKVKDKEGEWRLLKANDVWALLVWYRLSQLKAMQEEGSLPEKYQDMLGGGGCVIETWVTSDLIEAIANSFGLQTEYRPKVGFSAIAEIALDKIALPVLCTRYALDLEDVLSHYKEEGVQYIAEKLAKNRREVLREVFAILKSRLLGGFEESNGVSLGGHTLEKDGLLASVVVAEIAAYAKSQNTTLYEFLNNIYLEYGYYATANIPLELDELTGNADKRKIMESLGRTRIEANRCRGTNRALKIGPSEIIEAHSGREITHMDEEGYKFDFSSTDWIIPRPSGTEPKIRFYGQIKVKPSLLTEENIEQEKQQADQRVEDLVKQAQKEAIVEKPAVIRPTINPAIFKPQDIRAANAEKDLSNSIAEKIGRAYATFLSRSLRKKQPTVVIGRDVRASSPRIQRALIDGLISCGVKVIDLGMVSTPAMYFAARYPEHKADGGINVTGSHTSKEQNGMKLVKSINGLPDTLSSEEIQKIREIAEKEDFVTGEGERRVKDVLPIYLAENEGILRESLRMVARDQNLPLKGIRIVIECFCGSTGFVAGLFRDLGAQVKVLHGKPRGDGSFSVEKPEPAMEENLTELKQAVRDFKANLGIAYDCDGDRVAFVTERGKTCGGNQLLAVLALGALEERAQGIIIVNSKASDSVIEFIRKNKGIPFRWWTGYAHIRALMKELNNPELSFEDMKEPVKARSKQMQKELRELKILIRKGTPLLFGGEETGHVLYPENFYFDDGMYTTIKLLIILSKFKKKGQSLNQLIRRLPTTYYVPDIRMKITDEANAEDIKAQAEQAITSFFTKQKIEFIDGPRILFKPKYGWSLVRASETEPKESAVCEATGRNEAKRYLRLVHQALTSISGLDLSELEKVIGRKGQKPQSNPYPLPVPEKAHKDAVDKYGERHLPILTFVRNGDVYNIKNREWLVEGIKEIDLDK